MRHRINDHETQSELQRGAIEAFHEGSPETIQTILFNPVKFESYITPKRTLCNLAKGSNDPSAVISLALAKFSPQEKQRFLDNALLNVVESDVYLEEETFIAALLKAGANVNAEFVGSTGRILAMAITQSYPPSIIKLLHEAGASFESAELRINTRPYWDIENRRDVCIGKLKAYREAITGEPATEESQMQKTMELLAQAVIEITQRQERLEVLVQESIASRPRAKKTAAPQKAQDESASKKTASHLTFKPFNP